ncbi:MAG: poly-beta-1,6-N-acetyl-D-glucosamine synthase [Steroidobacteraceae bacterium]
MNPILASFLFLFPLVMSVTWTVGGAARFFLTEVGKRVGRRPTADSLDIPVSIIIPCFNEAQHLAATVGKALSINSRNFEVIAVDDGSTDETARILSDLARATPRLRVISLGDNQGKAAALRAAARIATHEMLICIDGDAYIDADAPAWLAAALSADPRLGAVTGNPRIRNRRTLLGKIQVGEYSAMIGMIKRTQTLFDCLFTLSGVIAGFRKSAVVAVDYWGLDALTEDMDITWRLQRADWRTTFEPRALVAILTPETFKGLWRQRLRWAMGGAQVMARNLETLWRPAPVNLRFLMVEMVLSVVWSYLLVASTLYGIGALVITWISGATWTPEWTAGSAGLVLAACGITQMAVGVALDRRYDPEIGSIVGHLFWYPLVFWLLQTATTVVAYPMVAFRQRGIRATWVSPDRGRS